MRLAYYPGCSARSTCAELNEATHRVAASLGLNLVQLETGEGLVELHHKQLVRQRRLLGGLGPGGGEGWGDHTGVPCHAHPLRNARKLPCGIGHVPGIAGACRTRVHNDAAPLARAVDMVAGGVDGRVICRGFP